MVESTQKEHFREFLYKIEPKLWNLVKKKRGGEINLMTLISKFSYKTLLLQ